MDAIVYHRRLAGLALLSRIVASVTFSAACFSAYANSEGVMPPASRSSTTGLLPPREMNSVSLRLPRKRLTSAVGDVGAQLPTQADHPDPKPWGSDKSYLIPALEIVGFQTLLNLFDRAYFGCCDFDTDLSSIRRNLRRSWAVDDSTFTVNQLGHPYQGSMYHGFARASGLNYWEGLAYTFLGSALWEIAGETTAPSKNDQITTGIGGTFLGEALFRMSNLWLEQGKGSPFWRELGAAAISPPVGLNRYGFGERFRGIFASNRPQYHARLQLGATTATHDRAAPPRAAETNEAIAAFALDYGLPGKPGYEYTRPFDYFSFQASAATGTGIDSVMTHGLLIGTDYGGKRHRGMWGLYGSYEYLAPPVFRFASTALSVGTTATWRLSRSFALHATGLVGVGYATVSAITDVENERANHYGVAPQAALALRFIMGDKAAFDVSAREYFVSDVSAGPRGGHDNVVRAEAALTWRFYREHGLSLRYQLLRRDAQFPDLGGRTQQRETIGIFYTILSDRRFGMGEWR